MLSSSSPHRPAQWSATIRVCDVVAPRHFGMTLHAPPIAGAAQAGQFVHILPRDAQLVDPLLRRAFSIMAARPEAGEIDILFRAGGSGTTQIASKIPGQILDLIGPLGRPFDLRLFHVKQPAEKDSPTSSIALSPILVGGGVGVPPLVFLGKSLREAQFEPSMLLGARGATEVLGLKPLGALGIPTHIATDDGSLGHHGRVTDLLEQALQNSPRAVVYACGPLPMLRAVAQITARFAVPCQVSLEENMPCGIGVCNGCVVAMKASAMAPEESSQNGAAEYGRYQRVCVAGPALWADEVDWEVR